MADNTEENTNANAAQTTDTTSAPKPETAVAVPTAEVVAESLPEVTTTAAVPEVSEVVTPASEVSTPVAEEVTVPASEPATVTDTVVPATPEVEVASAAPALAGVATRKKLLMQYGIAAVIVLVMGVGLAYALEQQGRINTGVFDGITEMVNPTPAAALVNGVKIPLANYEKNRTQLEMNAKNQGLDVADETIKAQIDTQAIDVLINTELLRQEAAKKNITATEDQIDARYKEIVDSLGGEEELEKKMAELAITRDSLMSDIEGEIIIQAFLSTAVDVSKISITPKEVEDVYNQANTPGAELPPLAQVKDQIASQIQSNKEQELVNAYIKTLRDGADVEMKI